MENGVWKTRHELIYRSRLSVIYHRRRERMYELMDRIAKSVAVVGGSALVFKVANDQIMFAFGLAVLFTSTLSLVFQYSSRATAHAGLAKDWSMIEKDICAQENITEVQICTFESRAAGLDGLEPRVLRALVADCQNELARAENEENFLRPLSLRQKLLMHFIDIEAPQPVSNRQ
jgi:hypothetical protein